MKNSPKQPTAQRIVERRAQKAVGLLKRLHRRMVEQMIDELIEAEDALAALEDGGWSPYDMQKIEERFLPRLPNLLLLPVNLASVASLGVVPAAQIAAQPLRDPRLPIDSDVIERDWFGELAGLTWLMGPCVPIMLWSATIGVE